MFKVFKYGRKFAMLYLKLWILLKDGSAAYVICNHIYHDLTCILKFWWPEQNVMRRNVRFSLPSTSPNTILVIQEFLTSYGMHLERITPEDTFERTFKIVPNW